MLTSQQLNDLLAVGEYSYNGQWISKKHLLDKCSGVVEYLNGIGKPKLLLACLDEQNFLIALLASMCTCKTLLIPQNFQDISITSLLNDDVLLLDDEVIEMVPEIKSNHPLLLVNLESTLILYTSGSTGLSKEVVKSWFLLLLEVENLQAQWPLSSSDIVLGTVSHQHIYGLLFRFLWPVWVKSNFIVQQLRYQEEVLAHYSENRVLITSPAFLSRLDSNLICTRPGKRIFSSGGPLCVNDARIAQMVMGDIPIEVFGSTETGGIAWRQQDVKHDQTPWNIFDYVKLFVNEEQRIVLTKGYFYDEGTHFNTDDKGQLLDSGKLRIIGRIDRTVKLFEKRVNLSQMEAHLTKLEKIKASRCLISGSRIVAFCVLSSMDLDKLSGNNKTSYVASLKQHMLKKFERVTVPKKWRFLSALPLTSQGKVDERKLRRMIE